MVPILYSFRRCPYAIRARLALAYCGVTCELREVSLKAKPIEMLTLSPKGTVPVLFLPESKKILEQSLDIMLWALKQDQTQSWLIGTEAEQQSILKLIKQNDDEFKPWLDKYKYPSRFPEGDQTQYFENASIFLHDIEGLLDQNRYLGGKQPNLADMAILPFIRQFASVNRTLFNENFPALDPWLEDFLNATLFKKIMTKYAFWCPQQPTVYFSPKIEL